MIINAGNAIVSPWHDELAVLLEPLDDASLSCDGMTYVISHLLKEAGIKHRCMSGYVTDTLTGNVIFPHLWIELFDGWVIDYRLRMWLGDEDCIPHGVFYPALALVTQYSGDVHCGPSEITAAIALDMSDGRTLNVKLCSEFVSENSQVMTS